MDLGQIKPLPGRVCRDAMPVSIIRVQIHEDKIDNECLRIDAEISDFHPAGSEFLVFLKEKITLALVQRVAGFCFRYPPHLGRIVGPRGQEVNKVDKDQADREKKSNHQPFFFKLLSGHSRNRSSMSIKALKRLQALLRGYAQECT